MQTKAQRFADLADSVTCLRAGRPPKRLGGRRRDGSMPVKPVEKSDQHEATVLQECLRYLRSRGCLANRQNNGSFQTEAGWHTYGIVGSGDIIAVGPGGIHIEVECKAGKGGLLSAIQQRRRDSVIRHGGKYVVVCSMEELRQWYESEVSGEVSSDEQLCGFEAETEGDE